MFAVREVNTTIILYSPTSLVLSVLAWNYLADGTFAQAAVVGVIQTLLMVAGIVIARFVFGIRSRQECNLVTQHRSLSADPVGLRVRDLVADYGGGQAVAGVSFDVEPSEFVTLLGPSGCGKTTTLRCVAGLHPVVAGTIAVGGEVLSSDRIHLRPERRRINMVFQSYAIWPHMTVFDNVAYGMKGRRGDRAERAARVA